MRPNLFQFIKISLSNFIEAVINIFIFLPYFFSVSSLLKTLFLPWKNLQAKKITAGFSFNEWLNRFAFNGISCGIGFFMRLSLLSFYFLIQAAFIIMLPVAGLFYLLLIPIFYIETFFQISETEKKQKIKNWFIATHMLEEGERNNVEKWFEQYYALRQLKTLTIPPLARDWAVGFTPTLDEYATDLTSSFYQKKIIDIVDREKEINQIERVLSQSRFANILIVGEEGVGKHTIVDALAKKMYEGKTTLDLLYKRILKLDMEKILARFTDQNQRKNFINQLFQEALEAKNVILFIDNFEKYIFLPLQTESVQIIGITTPFFYQKFIFPDVKLQRFFTKIDVYEVGEAEAEEILIKTAITFEKKYKIIIPYGTVKNIIAKSDFYITYIPFPEKAIELLDAICVYVKQQGQTLAKPEVVDKILTEKTHVPTTLTIQMKEKLLELETLLMSRVLRQEEAISKVSSTLRRSFISLGKRKKPLAAFLFLGPTGVGKTETAKAIASVFFGSEKKLLRFDMSLYQTKADIAKLIGSSVSGNPGLLSSTIRENPYGLLLLDEIEKADPDLINIFLTLLDEAYFSDGYGRKVDCKNLVVVATSNAGSDQFFQSSSLISQISLTEYLVEHHIFSPEFLNRFDGVIVYKPLSPEAILAVARKMTDEISADVKHLHNIELKVSDAYLSELAQKGYNQKFGARDMERLIREEIEDKVAKMILEDKVKEGDIISL